MKILRSLSRTIAKAEQGLLFGMLFLIVGVNLMQIGLRLVQSFLRTVGSDMVLSAPSWPADVNRILVLWIAMVGGSLATRSNEHIRVDFFSRLLRGKARSIIHGATCIIGIVVCAMLAYFSIDFLKMEYELEETLVAMPIRLWIIQLIIPVGFGIIAFRFFLQLFGGEDDAVTDPGASSSDPGEGAVRKTGGEP